MSFIYALNSHSECKLLTYKRKPPAAISYHINWLQFGCDCEQDGRGERKRNVEEILFKLSVQLKSLSIQKSVSE